MRFTAYEQLPQEARALREEVFCGEQGFQEEFDETDRTAHHGLLWDDGGQPVGVCRFFPGQNQEPGSWGGWLSKKPCGKPVWDRN